MTTKTPVVSEHIGGLILSIRGQKVILDRHLAELYGVKTIALRQQVKRNRDRFPGDFMFRLSEKEAKLLVSQNVIPPKSRLGGFLPSVFTQEGVAMLSSVLNSSRAVKVNIAIMRAFVRLRETLAAHKDLARRLDRAERALAGHGTELGRHAEEIKKVFETIRRLTDPPHPSRKPIGFTPKPAA